MPNDKQYKNKKEDKNRNNSGNPSSDKKNDSIDGGQSFQFVHVAEKLFSLADKASPDVNVVSSRITDFFDKLFLEEEKSILVGVSGGVDSTCLFDALYNLSTVLPIRLAAAHFNHKLRGKASDGDADFARNLARDYGVKFYESEGDVLAFSEANGASVETAARILRYRFLERIAKSADFDFVATAHTKDDLAETFFINLFRGSGLTGLRGIPAIRAISKKIKIIRPMIDVRKSEIESYAKARNLTFREDSSNASLVYTRNRIRKDLIPKIEKEYSPAIIETVARTARFIAEADAFVEAKVKAAIPSIIERKTKERLSIKVGLLKTYNDFMKGEILQSILKSNFNVGQISLDYVERLISLADSETGATVFLPNSLIALKDRAFLILSRETKNDALDVEVEKTGKFDVGDYFLELKEVGRIDVAFIDNPNVEFFDYDLIPFSLKVRSRREGDKFYPLGSPGEKLLSDFLIDRKIPLIDKKKIPILSSRTEIIWVCGLAISDKFKVTDKTERFLRAELIEKL